MHYFIIHSGSDYNDVMRLVNEWSLELTKSKFSVLKGDQEEWHDDARAKIRGAEKVIYVVGEKSSSSENIDWELDVALEENKEIYIYKLKSDYALNKSLLNTHKRTSVQKGERNGELVFSLSNKKFIFTDDNKMRDKLKDDDEYISSRLESSMVDNLDVAMKQYEMFVETSEELVRRKQTVNSFYITLNSLIISVVLAAFALTEEFNLFGESFLTSSFVICLCSIVGGIVCISWHSLLQSYADLNSSKMKIISYIESQLAYNLYDTEWQLVSKKTAKKKYKSFSKKEMFIAKLFLALYIILFIFGIIFAIL